MALQQHELEFHLRTRLTVGEEIAPATGRQPELRRTAQPHGYDDVFPTTERYGVPTGFQRLVLGEPPPGAQLEGPPDQVELPLRLGE